MTQVAECLDSITICLHPLSGNSWFSHCILDDFRVLVLHLHPAFCVRSSGPQLQWNRMKEKHDGKKYQGEATQHTVRGSKCSVIFFYLFNF